LKACRKPFESFEFSGKQFKVRGKEKRYFKKRLFNGKNFMVNQIFLVNYDKN